MVKSVTRANPALLWCADPIRLAEVKGFVFQRPTWLVSAAPADVLGAWFDAHPWMGTLGAVLFHADDAAMFAKAMKAHEGTAREVSVREFQCAGEGLYRAAGPKHVVNMIRYHETAPNGANRVDACVTAGFDVATALQGQTIWEVCAEHSGGLLAIGIAKRLGRAVACSGAMPHALGTTAATRHGVNLQVFTDPNESDRAASLGFFQKLQAKPVPSA